MLGKGTRVEQRQEKGVAMAQQGCVKGSGEALGEVKVHVGQRQSHINFFYRCFL